MADKIVKLELNGSQEIIITEDGIERFRVMGFIEQYSTDVQLNDIAEIRLSLRGHFIGPSDNFEIAIKENKKEEKEGSI